MIYNASKVRIKEIQNINDRLINNQGNHPQRRNVSVFALWRSVSPVCCLSQIKPIETKTSLISTQANPGDTGTLQKTNVRPLIDCLLGWRGPKNSLDRRPFQQGKRILFGWKNIPIDMSSVSFRLPFLPFFWKVYVGVRWVIYIPNRNNSTWTRNAPSGMQDPQPNCITTRHTKGSQCFSSHERWDERNFEKEFWTLLESPHKSEAFWSNCYNVYIYISREIHQTTKKSGILDDMTQI